MLQVATNGRSHQKLENGKKIPKQRIVGQMEWKWLYLKNFLCLGSITCVTVKMGSWEKKKVGEDWCFSFDESRLNKVEKLED